MHVPPASHPPPPTYQVPQQMPPWLADIHQGGQSLHTKADRQFADITTGLQTQGLRITHLETTAAEHTTQHQ